MPPATAGELAFSRAAAPAGVRRALTFAERVAYQHAVEEIYWRHRTWPKENARPKPPLDTLISQTQLERKVAEYLRKSQFVADHRGRSISGSELQAEMGRIAQHTRRPEMLRELFEALGNDPFVIAECLARPILAERLVGSITAQGAVEALILNTSTAQTDNLAEISPLYCNDTWTPATTVNAPDARRWHSVVWTGSEMIVWGGNNSIRLNTGGRYDPSTDSWVATSLVNAPAARTLHSAVWTGNEMIRMGWRR